MSLLIHRRNLLATAPALGAALAFGPAWAAKGPADLILANGRIYTGEPKRRFAEAVAVKNGVIAYVGTNAGAQPMHASGTQVVDLGGRLLLPGFIDPHHHVPSQAENLLWVNLGWRNTDHTLGIYRKILLDFRARNPGLKQIVGKGFDGWILPAIGQSQKRQPRQLLDDIISDIPVALYSWTGHQMWVNSKAIELAGLTKDTPDPQGGTIDRDPATGEPNGIVRENGGAHLILNKLPEGSTFTVEQYREAILSWQKDIAAPHGLTSVLVPTPEPQPNLFPAMQQLSDEGRLTARYAVAQWADENRGVEQAPELVAGRARYRGGRYFKLNTIKVFATGTTAAGETMIWPQDSLNRTFAALDKLGFQIFVHDVGPTSTYAATLDAFEYALKQNGPRDSRHIISHVRDEAAPLAARFKALGVRSDSDWHPSPKTIYDAGVHATISSDWPDRLIDPLLRISEGVKTGVPLETMIASATLWGAEALFAEKETGSITVGKAADMVVIDKDIFEIATDEIPSAKPVLTLFAGKELYRDPSFA